MTLQSVPGIITPPQMDAVAFGSMNLNISGAKAAYIFTAPKTGTIDRLSFRLLSSGGSTDTDIRLESVDGTSGNPSGTLVGTNTNVTVLAATLTGTGTWIEATLTAGAAVTKGDLLAFVIAPTGTPNNMIFSRITTGTSYSVPYSNLYTGAWTKSPLAPVCAVRYSDGTYPYIPGVWPVSGISNSATLTTATTPDELGNVIQFPIKCRVSGVQLDNGAAAGNSDFDIVLYDASSNVLLTKSYDASNLNGSGILLIDFGGTQILSPNTIYRLVFKPTTTTSRGIRIQDVSNASLMAAMPLGTTCYSTSRTDAGSWTDLNTRRVGIGLVIDQLDDGVVPYSFGTA